MKFSCAKSDFERAAVIAERFTGKQAALPALSHVLITAETRGLLLTATNLEHAIELRVSARVSQEGRVAVQAKVLASLLQSAGDSDIQGKEERGRLHMKIGAREVWVNGANADDFPIVPKIKKTMEFSLDAESLARSLSRVLPAASTSEFKPELSGVFFHARNDTLTLCATDTFRLAEATLQIGKKDTGDGRSLTFILPHRSATELSRLLDGSGGDVVLGTGESQMSAETDGGILTSRLVEGAFPEYQAIIPGRFSTSAYIARDDAIRGARAASIFASRLQEMRVRLEDKQMEISAENPDIGEYHTDCPASVSGKSVAMSFNWRYFLDGLSALDDEEIFFGCNDATSPALLRNKSRPTFTYVVMPIRLT